MEGARFGAFAGIPAGGQGVWITAISIHRVVDGLIQGGWTGFERVKWGATEGSASSILRELPKA